MKVFVSFMTLLMALSLNVAYAADECWITSEPKGYSAYADQSYAYVKDGMPNPLMVCFGTDRGSVTGTDIPLVKFGNSTLAGFGNYEGVETFEVYQIDRSANKLLYVKSRIGTKSAYPLFSDVVSSYVADARPVPRN